MVIFAPKNWDSSIFLYFNVMKIKNLFYALMVPFAFLAFWACQDEPVLPPAVNLAEDQATINAGGEETSVLIKPTRDWTATVAEDGKWLTVTPSSGTASSEAVVEVKLSAEPNEGEKRSVEVTFTAGNINEVLTVTQEGSGGQGGDDPDIEEGVITIAEFLSKPVDNSVYYKLKGTMNDLFNTEYGNFHLVDATGDVLVYGLTAEKQSSNDKSFSTLGLQEGDVIVIEGYRDEHNGEAQVGGAYYIGKGSDEGGDTPDPEPGDYVSIADIRAKAPATQKDSVWMDDGVAIKAFVVSSIEANTLTSKKNVYVQDETGGLQIRFTSDVTWNFGDELSIDISGAKMKYYGGALQIDSLSNSKVEVLSTGNAVEAKQVSVADFMEGKYESQYVALPDVQVVEADLGKTFVMGSSHTSINVEDITGHSFVIFSSKYTVFGTEQVPQGAGTLKGVSMVYNGTMQIGLTSKDDYAGMIGARFDGQGGDTPDPGEIEEVTIAEFLAKAEGETYYKLTGTVTSIENDSWGNLTIEDESGNVYVYGVAKDKASVGSGPSFSGLGVEVGDILTIAGKRASFKGDPQVGDAYYISHEKGQGGGDTPDPGEIEEVTVSEFLSKPVDGSVYYRLTGTITDLYNTTYGNFTLVDETGSVLVYGLTAEKQTSNDKSFSTLGLKEGDIVTLEGTRDEYEGEIQVGGPAYYISHIEGETPELPESDPKALIISEYSEGKSFNKFLEITNISDKEVNLSGYMLRIYTNGSESDYKEKQLSGTLAAGASKVYCHSDADLSLLPEGVEAESIQGDNVINFNGNDPMAIICGDTLTDICGEFGGADFGKDCTLRRNSTVKEPSATYDPAEWEVLGISKEDLSGFGSHTME